MMPPAEFSTMCHQRCGGSSSHPVLRQAPIHCILFIANLRIYYTDVCPINWRSSALCKTTLKRLLYSIWRVTDSTYYRPACYYIRVAIMDLLRRGGRSEAKSMPIKSRFVTFEFHRTCGYDLWWMATGYTVSYMSFMTSRRLLNHILIYSTSIRVLCGIHWHVDICLWVTWLAIILAEWN